ncbi:hypothetical protein UT300018_27670 [Clostridium faecium]|uniref:Uncharacterized protein n=1 Tax=Clostridium faecium TaxID=2762223 RepID=A0ABR8YUV6_9CLOT|nr:hypothetical protein [Clostridium faecium]MBD8047974.1 hypothetical protein [Clostridium faecium]
MNNYMVILANNESVFIHTNAKKNIATKILVRYYLLELFKATCGNITNFFNEYGYVAKELSETKLSLYNTFATKNYEVIDLSSLPYHIRVSILPN